MIPHIRTRGFAGLDSAATCFSKRCLCFQLRSGFAAQRAEKGLWGWVGILDVVDHDLDTN